MPEVYTQNCPDCGIFFGIPKEMEATWRTSHKQFFCPNGHSLSWRGETPQQKELVTLRKKVETLQTKLDAALKDVADQTKKVEELTLKLEIWEPSDKQV